MPNPKPATADIKMCGHKLVGEHKDACPALPSTIIGGLGCTCKSAWYLCRSCGEEYPVGVACDLCGAGVEKGERGK